MSDYKTYVNKGVRKIIITSRELEIIWRILDEWQNWSEPMNYEPVTREEYEYVKSSLALLMEPEDEPEGAEDEDN